MTLDQRPIKRVEKSIDVALTCDYILRTQRTSGEIPWSADGKTDPWDHVESAMGLTIGGHLDAARRAYLWSRRKQLSDGSWWSEYRHGQPVPNAHKDVNMTAYIAVGVYHYYLTTKDRAFVALMWPSIAGAMDFVLDLQAPGGQICWAKRADGTVSARALLTGSSSIYLSLRCALALAAVIQKPKPRWQRSMQRLDHAIRQRPLLFDQTKQRFSMDWYYPILCGIISGDVATARIDRYWEKFVISDWGCRCVSDRPWVTMAETAELAMALVIAGDRVRADLMLHWISTNRYDDGAFWTGVTVPDGIIYTDEKTTWTCAAILLAMDILYDLTPASRLFSQAVC